MPWARSPPSTLASLLHGIFFHSAEITMLHPIDTPETTALEPRPMAIMASMEKGPVPRQPQLGLLSDEKLPFPCGRGRNESKQSYNRHTGECFDLAANLRGNSYCGRFPPPTRTGNNARAHVLFDV